MKRLLDVVIAVMVLLLSAPILVVAALGIKLSSPGPVLFRAGRVGHLGRAFTLHKLRTMHVNQGPQKSRITSVNDRRVFPFGRFLRATKIDELPQLYDVLIGTMSIVGPRPEDEMLVDNHYEPKHMETLHVRPGLTSPGTLYHYTHCAPSINGVDAEQYYVERCLPVKLALDLVYVHHASLLYDLRVMLRTGGIMAQKALGRRRFPNPPEMRHIAGLVRRASSAQPDSSPTHSHRH